MADERSYIEANTRERERLRALVARLDDAALRSAVNEYWTVAGVLGHMAYWDVRVLVLAEKIRSGQPWVAGDQEPDGDWLNDSTRPFIHAIPPREAAQMAVRIAEETDALVAELPLGRMQPLDESSPIWPGRSDHRAEHLDEIEASLRAQGRSPQG
jgi:Mycothiol maleylpyruvate isomerase N-terminal domain